MEKWHKTTLRLDATLQASIAAHANYFGCSQQHLMRELLRIGAEKMQEFQLLSAEDQVLFMPENAGIMVLPSLPGEGRKIARRDERDDRARL